MDLLHVLFASAYQLEAAGEFYKGADPAGNAAIELGWRTSIRGRWVINFGIEILDYFYLRIKTETKLFDVHPFRIGFNLPDYIDNYSSAMAAPSQSCFGINFDTTFLNIGTTFAFNFKKIEVSFFDIF